MNASDYMDIQFLNYYNQIMDLSSQYFSVDMFSCLVICIFNKYGLNDQPQLVTTSHHLK